MDSPMSYLLLIVSALGIICCFTGRKTCTVECPKPEKILCFATCKEISEHLENCEKKMEGKNRAPLLGA
jgi:hypothetical protein